LVSQNPELQGFPRAQQALRDCLEEVRGALSSQREIRNLIEKLVRAGADSDTVLAILALNVRVQEDRSQRGHWLPQMRRKKRSLKILAAKIRETARAVEKSARAPESYPDLWEVALRKVRVALREVRDGAFIPVAKRVPKELLAGMRAHADDVEARALGLGRLSKSQLPRFTREPLVYLLDYLHHATGDIKPHFQTQAEILAAAYDTCKIAARYPTKESLEITFRRHSLLRPRLKR
jgi:hypothetical protein